MLLCAANGGALFGSEEGAQSPYVRPENKGDVLFLSLEDDRPSVGRRLRAIFEARGRKPTAQDLERLHVIAWDELKSDRVLFRLNDSKEIAATGLFDAATTPTERLRYITMTPAEARAELAARGIDPRGRHVRPAPMVNIHTMMSPGLRKRLDVAAGKRGVSRSDLIRAAVEAMLDGEGA
jgi:hypothetical protein